MNACSRGLLALTFALLILLPSVSFMNVYATTFSAPTFCIFRHQEPVCVEHDTWIVTFTVAQGSGQICWSSGTRGACTSTSMQAHFDDGDSVTITAGATFNHWQLSCQSYYLLACGTMTSTVNPLRETVPFAGSVQGYFN